MANEIIFPLKPTSYKPGDIDKHLVFLPPHKTPCLLQTPSSQPRFAIIFFHGNYSDVGEMQREYEYVFKRFCIKAKAHFVCPEYPGYGLAQSVRTTAKNVNEVAAAALDFVQEHLHVPPERVLVVGRSIGSGAATELAAKMCERDTPPYGLVLLSAFRSIRSIAKERAGWFAALVLSERFDNERRLQSVRCPVWLVHGSNDQVIPEAHSEALRDTLLRTLGPELVRFKLTSGGHNRMPDTWLWDFLLPTLPPHAGGGASAACLPARTRRDLDADLLHLDRDEAERRFVFNQTRPSFTYNPVLNWSITKISQAQQARDDK